MDSNTYNAGPNTRDWRPAAPKPGIPRGLLPMPYDPKYGRCPGIHVGEKLTITARIVVDGETLAVTYHGAIVIQEDERGYVVNVPPDLCVTWELVPAASIARAEARR